MLAVSVERVPSAVAEQEQAQQVDMLAPPPLLDGAQIDLEQFPRRTYTHGQTALHPLDTLSELELIKEHGVNVWIKRDDQLGLVMGGNKTRKLEFAMAHALQSGADSIITMGAIQSNHARLTLAACNKEGLDCYLVLEERVPGSYKAEASGNFYLYQLLGAQKVIVVQAGQAAGAAEELRQKLLAEGRSPFVIPGGASDVVGAKGYVRAAQELRSQMEQVPDTKFDAVVCASGSSGTHAGMVVGMRGSDIPVIGVSTRFDKDKQEKIVLALANKLTDAFGAAPVDPALVYVDDKYVGPGYSLPTPESTDAIQILARSEGILLDPVYTGKAFAGLLGMIEAGYFKPGSNVIFLHTGGSPALFEYRPLGDA